MNNLLIGTSGYDYPEWKGVFYPNTLSRKDFLPYYAAIFNALEINNTFYRMPDASNMRSFLEKTGGKVNFSIKANSSLTHCIKRDWKDSAAFFKDAMNPLLNNGVLSSILFQFPQSFHYTNDNRFYLDALLHSFEGFPCVIEFRHKEWIRESVFEGLVKRNASVAFCDMPALKYLPSVNFSEPPSFKTQFIGPNAYIRLHGRNAKAWYSSSPAQNGSARYDYDYSDEELQIFVPVIKNAILEGKKVSVFFNNHPNGHGSQNARKLLKMTKE